MDTRVLTLFDDEDFFPREEPKKKVKKETIAATSVKPVEEPEQPIEADHTSETPETEQIKKEETEAVTETEYVETVAEPEETIPEAGDVQEAEIVAKETEHTEAVTATHDIIDEPKNKTPEVTLNQEEMVSEEEVDEEKQLNEIAAADEELNKQILSELIQVDYASLIHRDYPFDMNQASVVSKHKVIHKTEDRPAEEETGNEEEDDEVFEDVAPLPEWSLDKKYYTIGEVAQLFAVNTSHIRFWTNEFKLKPRTTRKGDRLYNPKDIAELRLIHHLVKEKKHTIKGAKEKLKAGKTDVNNKLDLKDSLINLRDTLLQIKAQL